MPDLFINCDWGTSRFRLRAVRRADVEVVAEFGSDQGVARLAEGDPTDRVARFRDTLREGLCHLAQRVEKSRHKLGAAPCLVSGMASSSVGWQELPYARVPLPIDGSELVWHELEPIESGEGTHRVILVSGLASHSDVMRGEETQLVGLFQLPVAKALAARSLVVMPGTHSKHVTIHNNQIIAFWTFMTGELYEVLGEHSILRHSIGQPTSLSQDLSGEVLMAFRWGVEWAGARPLSAALFRVRTRQVLDRSDPLNNRAFLSGVLVGSELSYLAGEAWRIVPIVLCAAEPLANVYTKACDVLGLAERMTVISPAETARLSALGQRCLLRQVSM